MKNNNQIWLGLFSLIITAFISSCSSDVKIGKIDYSKCKVERMDLSHATSLGIINNNSRADGTFVENGLYKVDENGNISTVAIYLVQDEENDDKYRYETHTMHAVPEKLKNLTESYFVVLGCKYYDENGEYGDVPYRDLLVRKSDGKIWCVDNLGESTQYILWNDFTAKENEKGELYIYSSPNIYKFNLGSYIPSFEQLNRGVDFSENFYFTIGDVIWNGGDVWGASTFIWPNLGFQQIGYTDDLGIFDFGKCYIQDNVSFENGSDLSIMYVYNRDNIGNYIVDVNHEPFLISLCYQHYLFDDSSREALYDKYQKEGYSEFINVTEEMPAAKVFKLNIGNQPGSIEPQGTPILGKYSNISFEPIQGSATYEEFHKSFSFASNERYILSAYNDAFHETKTRLSLIDIKNGTWENIKDLDFYFKFGYSSLKVGTSKVAIPEINNGKITLHWIDFNNRNHHDETLGLEVANYLKNQVIKDWYLILSGVNPSTGNTETVEIDLSNGNVSQSVEEPNMIFETIVPLN